MSDSGAANNVGHQNGLAVSTTAVTLTVPARARRMIVYVRNNPCRWRADGTNPTATTGMYVGANTYLEFMEPEESFEDLIRRFAIIRDATAGGDATLEVAYFD